MRERRPIRRRSRTGRSRPFILFSEKPPPSFDQRRALCGRIELAAVRGLIELARDVLAKLHPELVERVDVEQHGVRERAVLVEGDQRAQRPGIEPVEQDGRARAIAGIAAVRIVALLARASARRPARRH